MESWKVAKPGWSMAARLLAFDIVEFEELAEDQLERIGIVEAVPDKLCTAERMGYLDIAKCIIALSEHIEPIAEHKVAAVRHIAKRIIIGIKNIVAEAD